MKPIVFFRVAWMREYKGITKTDIPLKGGSDEGKGEVYNFQPIKNLYYGYVWVKGDGNLNLNNISTKHDNEKVEDVTVVFFATHPENGGQRIVGWYKNATVYSEDKRIRTRGYRAVSKDIVFINEEDRIFRLPKNGPGTSHVWYGKNISAKQMSEIENYLASPKKWEGKQKKADKTPPRQNDVALRLKVETAAMKAVEKHYIRNGYDVKYVHKDNVGWDMEATYGTTTLLLEVKGLSGDFNTIELTHNEYTNSTKKGYRICIVSNALSARKTTVDIFYMESGSWVNSSGHKLKCNELISARFSKNN